MNLRVGPPSTMALLRYGILSVLAGVLILIAVQLQGLVSVDWSPQNLPKCAAVPCAPSAPLIVTKTVDYNKTIFFPACPPTALQRVQDTRTFDISPDLMPKWNKSAYPHQRYFDPKCPKWLWSSVVLRFGFGHKTGNWVTGLIGAQVLRLRSIYNVRHMYLIVSHVAFFKKLV